MERAKEELDRLTVEPPPNPSEELVRLQLLASVMLEALKEIYINTQHTHSREVAAKAISLAEQYGEL